jgi:hypothetical protein
MAPSRSINRFASRMTLGVTTATKEARASRNTTYTPASDAR